MKENHHIVLTNRRLSCTFDWTGAQLSNLAKTPIEAAEKRTNDLEKYISVVYLSEFGTMSFFLHWN